MELIYYIGVVKFKPSEKLEELEFDLSDKKALKEARRIIKKHMGKRV